MGRGLCGAHGGQRHRPALQWLGDGFKHQRPCQGATCLVPIVTYYLFGFGTERKWTKGLLMLVLHYVISLACAWLLIYLAGLLQHNARTAYWDMLISFTVAYAVVAGIIALANRRARKERERAK